MPTTQNKATPQQSPDHNIDRAIHSTSFHVLTPPKRPVSIQTRYLSANTQLLLCIVQDLLANSGACDLNPNPSTTRSTLGHTKTLRMHQAEYIDIAPAVLSSLKENFEQRSGPTNKNQSHKRRSHARGPGRQPLRPITDRNFASPRAHATNKQFCQPSQASTAVPTQPSSTKQTVFSRVLATDPAATAALWAIVRGAMPPKKRVTEKNQDNDRGRGGRGRGRGSGRGRGGQLDGGQHDKKKRKLNVPQGDTSDELGEELSDMPRTVPQSAVLTANDTMLSDVTKITAHSRHFKSLVLLPRRLVAEEKKEAPKSAYSHFETIAPRQGDLLDYTAIEGLDAAEVWLSLPNDQVEQIIEEYEFMNNKQVCEQEYASFATETFLRRQRRFNRTPTDRKWRAERMLQLIAPPTESYGSYWVTPPSFEEGPEFKFELRPDCSYWLSLAGFNSDYRSELSSALYVHNNWITCPYFTIEFKKHRQSIDQATWQACAAASVPLYNRYLLKCNALAVGAEEWTDFDRAQMKHYVLTFVGAEYGIWVLRARFSEDSSAWDGCSMTNIYRSMCTSKAGVRRLESWINEIHRWGLSVHAAGCQVDVKKILREIEIEISVID